MTKDSTTVLIKKEPDALQQEQDDLIFSYLNADYMSTDVSPIDDPPSPPYSTSSGSTDTAHLNNTDMDMLTDSSPPTTTATTFCVEDPFFLQLQTALSEQGIPWPTTATTTFATSAATTIPFPGVQDPSCLMNIHPLMLPTSTTANTTVTANQNTILSQPFPPSYLPIDNHHNNTRSYSFSSSSSSSSSDNEQSKKKRTGRKKREVSIAPAPLKSLAPILPAASMTTTTNTASSLEKENHHHVGKVNASSVNSSLDKIPSSTSPASSSSSSSSNNNNNNNNTINNNNSNNNMNHTNNNNNNNNNSSQPIVVEKTAAEIAYAKRQERLIKNRAAALLSRKRKREHLTTLEEERQKLLNENTELKSKVDILEDKISTLEKENLELKNKLSSSSTATTSTTSLSSPISFLSSQKFSHHHHLATPKHAKTTGMVFMIILFSFALFTLPSSHTSDQLTVGGSPKPNIPLIGPSTSRIPDIKLESIENNSDETTITATESKTEEENTITTTTTATNPISTTDLILINRVQPKDLHSWVKNKLIQNQNNGTTELIQWNRNEEREQTKEISETTSNHLYLYAKEFSQLGLSSSNNNNIKQDSSTIGSTLSIICPLNTTSHCETNSASVDAYLQIDVLVVGSRVLQGELKHQFNNEEDEDMAFNDQALLNNIKDEMIESILFKSSSPSPSSSSSSSYMINDYSSLSPINDHTKKTILNRRKIRRKLLDEKRKRFSRVVLE